jgi:hypothetical protein
MIELNKTELMSKRKNDFDYFYFFGGLYGDMIYSLITSGFLNFIENNKENKKFLIVI